MARTPVLAAGGIVLRQAELPLGEAVERLSRGHERAFLQQVGPIALAAANGAEGAALPKVAEPVVPEHKADRVGFLQNLLRLFR